jgi:predicted O-methyltransferase YrrM
VEKRFDANLAAYGNRVTKVVGGSVQSLVKLGAARAEFDLIYIDADHRRDAVMVDTLLAWPLLRNGGIVIWDDYLFHPELSIGDRPQQAVDLFVASRQGEAVVLHQGYQVIAQKRVGHRGLGSLLSSMPLTVLSLAWRYPIRRVVQKLRR